MLLFASSRAATRLLPALLAPLSLLASPAVAAEPVRLTLDDAIRSVEGVNLTVLLGREAINQAAAQAEATRAGVLPNLTASLQQRRSQTVTISNQAATTTGPFNRFDALLSGSYNVLDPVRRSALRSANLSVDVARADYQATLQLVIASLVDRYFAHLRNLRRLDVLDANIARARALLVLAQNQFRAGTATQIDVTRAEAQLAQAEQARLQQETVGYQSEMALKRALDLEPARPLILQDFTVKRTDLAVYDLPDDQQTYVRRSDYLRAQKALEQARIDTHTATFERWPVLALSGQYGKAAPNIDRGNRKENWFFGGLVTVPIFDGMRATADHKLTASRQRAQEYRLHNLERQISAELRLATQDARSRNAQITMAEKNLKLAQDQLRLAQQRYQQGVADNREVVEAQTQLAIAEDSLVEAGYQYNLSRLELARTRGDVRTILQERAE